MIFINKLFNSSILSIYIFFICTNHTFYATEELKKDNGTKHKVVVSSSFSLFDNEITPHKPRNGSSYKAKPKQKSNAKIKGKHHLSREPKTTTAVHMNNTSIHPGATPTLLNPILELTIDSSSQLDTRENIIGFETIKPSSRRSPLCPTPTITKTNRIPSGFVPQDIYTDDSKEAGDETSY